MPDDEQKLVIPIQAKTDISQVAVTPMLLPVELWRSLLLTQLTECWNDVRNIDSLVWQIPAGIGAIIGLILTGLGRSIIQNRPSLLDVAAMIAAVLVSFALIMALRKNRIFQVSRNVYIKAIYRALLETNAAQAGEMISVGLQTDDCSMDMLPGCVPRATQDLASFTDLQSDTKSRFMKFLLGSSFWQSVAKSHAGKGVTKVGNRLSNASAYKMMFRVSVSIVVGETLLAFWLLARFLRII
jgi:hypothetical protein